MARAPFQVLVFPYRLLADGGIEYALFRRADAGWWQGIAGGGEDDESTLAAAMRETWEEAGLRPERPFLRLDTTNPVPATAFRDSHLWGDDVYVIPEHCFGVDAAGLLLILSDEHSEYRWLSYEAADHLLRYDG